MNVLRRIKSLLIGPYSLGKIQRIIRQTSGTAGAVTWKVWFIQRVLGINSGAYWPMSYTSTVIAPKRVRTGIGTAPGLSPGCYIQAINGIEIGDYTLIGPNVGIVSANHSLEESAKHKPDKPIKIGCHCWIGMNSVILPGVVLGDHTVIAAGSIVKNSFPKGKCILAGNPAQLVKELSLEKIIYRRNSYEYVGYYSMENCTKEQIFKELGVDIV